MNYHRLITLLEAFSEKFEIIIIEHVSRHLKSKFNPHQHGSIKSKSTSTNLVAYLDSITRLVHTHPQVDAIYFDFSNTFDAVSRAMLLRKLDGFRLPPTYVTRFRSYLPN